MLANVVNDDIDELRLLLANALAVSIWNGEIGFVCDIFGILNWSDTSKSSPRATFSVVLVQILGFGPQFLLIRIVLVLLSRSLAREVLPGYYLRSFCC